MPGQTNDFGHAKIVFTGNSRRNIPVPESMLRAAGTGPDRPPSLRPTLEMSALRGTVLVEMPGPSRLNDTGWHRAAQDLGLPVSSSAPERYSQMPSTTVSL